MNNCLFFFYDERTVNKQLNDKERVAAAMENPNLRQLVDECLYSSELWIKSIINVQRAKNEGSLPI